LPLETQIRNKPKKGPLKNHLNNSEDMPQVVERVDHSINWKALILIVTLVVVLLLGPKLYQYVSNQIDVVMTWQTEISPPPEKTEQASQDTPRPATFDEVLDAALRYDRQGNRIQAELLFRELIKQTARNASYTEQMVALFPRAADFYSKGNEIPAKEVENLYLDALDAIKRFHGNDYYDYENVYRGLEKLYISQGRYKEAATQTRVLLEFYRRNYNDNKDAQFALMQPTTVRLGQNLIAAREYSEARDVLQAALEMSQKRGRPVSHIEEFIKKTYQEEAIPSTINEASRMPASIGANMPAVTHAPVPAPAGKDIKSAIEAISLDGIIIEQLQENIDRITIIGYADNNKTVAKYMRLLLEKVGEPSLNFVKQEEQDQKTVSAFSMTMKK
jgi:tetratricopeptide (TPR) repeat protein